MTPASGYTHGRDQRGRVHQPVQRCRSCKAPMLWVTMPSGKRNPLDAESSASGNVMVVQRTNDAGEHWRLGVVVHDPALRDEAEGLGIKLYTSHFATCPDADEHRKPRERKDLA